MSGSGQSYYPEPYSNPQEQVYKQQQQQQQESQQHQHPPSSAAPPYPSRRQHSYHHSDHQLPSTEQYHHYSTSGQQQQLASSSSSQHDAMPTPSSSRNPRRASRASSHGASEPENDIKLTRTGRVSKALKGQRVHKCVYCEKIFTRAEHCRRHQLNHGPPQVCNVPGCEKKFYREDLFQRHKEEHTLYGQASNQSPSMMPPSASPSPYPYGTPGSSRGYEQGQSLPYPPGHNHPYFINHSTFGTLDSGYGSSTPSGSIFASPEQFATTFPATDLSEDIYASGPPYFPVEFNGQQSMDGTSGSRSPASVSSSLPHNWNQHENMLRLRDNSSPSESEMSLRYDPTLLADLGDVNAFGLAPAALHDHPDRMDEVILVRELAAAIPGLHIKGGPDALAYLGPQKNQFMESYWRHFHHQFPVVHRPTFDAVGVPLLLSVLMHVLGAQYMDDPAARQSALILRDACFKVLETRAVAPYEHCRLWDMQITFLAETLSMYRSRRPMIRFSDRFDSLCTGLNNDHDVFFAKPLQTLAASDEASIQQRHNLWVHSENKRRLFLACHMLEAQHSILFGTGRMTGTQDVPMPCSSQLWEASTLPEWCALAEQEPHDPIYLFESLAQSQPFADVHPQLDNFNSSLLIVQSCLDNSGAYANIGQYLDSANETTLTFNAFALAKLIPIHALLSVSGKTFVLGQKLATADQYADARSTLDKWTDSPEASMALRHALQVMSTSYNSQHQPLFRHKTLHEDWALNLAALVCWALAIWPLEQAQNQDSASRSIGGSGTPIPEVELDMRMATFLSRTQQQQIDGIVSVEADEARTCLQWTRSQLVMPLLGGLLGDAGEVLAKLVRPSNSVRRSLSSS